MDNYKFKIKTGEVGKEIAFYIKDADGALVDLSDKPVYFTVTKGATVIIDLGVCVNDPDQTVNKGKSVYTFTAEDVGDLAAGEYRGELCVVDGGNPLFYPNSDVKEKDYITIKVTKPLSVPS
jgi:hypothetical protein